MRKPLLISFFISLSALCSFSQEPFNNNQWVTNLPETVVDIDSNVYNIQKLGEQLWLKENLKVTRFNNGDEIQLTQTDSLWTISKYPSYSNLIGIRHTSHGLDSNKTNEILYNYFVVSDTQNVCPVGWKVPDTADWNKLESYMEKANEEFSYATGLIYPPNYKDTIDTETRMDMLWNANYNVGFSSNPYGYRSARTGEFVNYLDYGYWWSNNSDFIATAWARIQNRGFGIDDIHLEENKGNKQSGYSIKCIKE